MYDISLKVKYSILFIVFWDRHSYNTVKLQEFRKKVYSVLDIIQLYTYLEFNV